MIQFLKRLVARKELAQLQAYQKAVGQCSTWFSNYEHISQVLTYVREQGEGTASSGQFWDIMALRESMRTTVTPKVTEEQLTFAQEVLDALKARETQHIDEGDLDKARRYGTLFRAFSPFVRQRR